MGSGRRLEIGFSDQSKQRHRKWLPGLSGMLGSVHEGEGQADLQIQTLESKVGALVL